MNEYIFLADLLNKYSQLTPWVQALIAITLAIMVLVIAYFIKESIALIMKPFTKEQAIDPHDTKQEWKDSYYRSEEPLK